MTLADLFSYNEKVESLLNSFTWKTQFWCSLEWR
jgi:hypothetical protein